MAAARTVPTVEIPLTPDTRVLVVGLGRTGRAVGRWVVGQGAALAVADRAEPVSIPSELEGAEPRPFASTERSLEGVDLVVPSPGVPADAPILADAVARGIPVLSEIEVASRQISAPLAAVTGTNGKSTTTELLACMLRESGARVFAGGNLGTPLIEAAGGAWDVVVAEVSSFQLEWVETFRPRVGVWLNVTEDHLDRHGDIEAYAAVKARLLARQGDGDVAVLSRDDRRVWSLGRRAGGAVLTFGATPLESSEGARVDGDSLRVVRGGETKEFSLAHCALLGAHNQENLMAATLAALELGASDRGVQTAIETFSGLSHRMQEVHVSRGVRFLDDSKATNVGALLRSIDGLPDGRVVLVAGGRDKGGDFRPARGALARKARLVSLYGEAATLLGEAWGGAVPLQIHRRFEDAVRSAADAAEPGDAVLLSPACASFDQFEDYAERGDAFAALVRTLS